MKKILAFMLIIVAHVHSFAINLLQEPPTPFMDPGDVEDDGTPINFLVPFLLMSIVALLVYYNVNKKNKVKSSF